MTILGGILRHGLKPQCAARVRAKKRQWFALGPMVLWSPGDTRRCPRLGRWVVLEFRRVCPTASHDRVHLCTRHFRKLYAAEWAAMQEAKRSREGA